MLSDIIKSCSDNDDYAIIMTDRKIDAEDLVKALSSKFDQNALLYTGGTDVTTHQRQDISTSFRNEESQFLVATESYQVSFNNS